MMQKRFSSAIAFFIGLSALFAGACGGGQEAVNTPSNEGSGDDGQPKRKSMGIEAEIGALDEGEVKRAFERVSKQLVGCYGKGAERISFLSGEISFKLRVSKSGGVRWVYVKDSNLGDRATENCMLGVLRNQTWPKPIDGEEGLAENSFAFEPGGDERMPIDWTPERMGDAYAKEAKGKLSQCRADAGTGPIKATLYVDTEGKARSVGVSVSDEKGEAAVDCVVNTLSALKYASPGSFDAKVSVTID